MNFLLVSDVNNRREKHSVLTESGSSEKLLQINNEEVKNWTPYLVWEVQCTLESFLNDTEEIEIVESFYSSNQRTQEMTISAMINSFLTSKSFKYSSTAVW